MSNSQMVSISALVRDAIGMLKEKQSLFSFGQCAFFECVFLGKKNEDAFIYRNDNGFELSRERMDKIGLQFG